MLNRSMRALFLAVALTLPCLSPVLADTTPGQAYLELHKKELAAKSYADIAVLRAKASIAQDKMDPKEQDQLFPLLKSLMPHDVTVVSEKVTGDSATLNVVAAPDPSLKPGDKETTTGVVELLKEDGQWKLNREKWDSKAELH